jgi:DNA topoisomerase-1
MTMMAEGGTASGLAVAGLRAGGVSALTIVRRRRGRGFAYLDRTGKRIADPRVLDRIAALAVPPAYRDVRIAADPRAHLQAVGRDEAGRLQYRYHPGWEAVREAQKLERLAATLAALPRLRKAVRADLAGRDLTRDKALACAVAIMDGAHIRVGCEDYLKLSGSRGAATLMKDDVEIGSRRIELGFRGKGGKDVSCVIEDAPLARALKRVAALPGRRLVKYENGDGARAITARDVNAYLAQATGRPITAKDLRQRAGCVLACERFLEMQPGASETARKKQVAGVMRSVSEILGNTPAVARKSYVATLVVDAFLDGRLAEAHRRARGGGGRNRIEETLRRLLGQAKPDA